MKGQNKNDESRLLPIWALAAANLSEIDHTNKATRVSLNKHKCRESESYLQSSKNYSSVGGGEEVTRKPLVVESTNSDTKASSPVANSSITKPMEKIPSSSPSFDGSIQWVKSGNKWIMSDKGKAKLQRDKEPKSGDAKPFHSPSGNKVNPTAVSSFAAGNHFEIPKFSETASVFGSIASSTSGLYSKSKMATTPNGFSYMPALHLKRNGSKVTSSSNNKFFANSINSNIAIGPIHGSVHGKSKVQRSYFVEGLGKGIKRLDKSEDDLRTALSLFDDSGYDSDGTRAERMREWKEQFVQKHLSTTSSKTSMKKSSSVAKSSSSFQSTRAKSFESDYDSEVHATNARLKQWKEEQYRMYNLSKRVDENTDSKQSRKDMPFIQISMSLPDTGYDSDSSRQRRLKEWKEQQLAQISNMKDQPIENDDSPIDKRRGKAIPGRGLFPATSPVRKSKMDVFGIDPDSPFQSPNVRKENTGDCLKSSSIRELQTLQPPKESAKKHTRKNVVSRNDYMATNLNYSLVRPQDEYSIQLESNDAQMKRAFDLPYWDNCLYVKAEGARSGTIFLTQTYLVFVYDDEVADGLLSQYGWQRHQVADLLLDIEEPSSRSATPVNVPLGQTGEGEAVELIGEPATRIRFNVLLEDGFNCESTRCKPQSSNTPSSSPTMQSSNETIDLSEDGPALFSSSVQSDNKYIHTNQSQVADETQSGKQYLRSIREESMFYDKPGPHDGPIYAPANGLLLDSDTIHNNFTNLSSFTELDIEFNQDDETSIYITGDIDSKQNFVGVRWPLSKLGEVFERRYMMKEVAIEIFAPSSSSLTTKNLWSDLSDGLTEIDVPLGPLSNFSMYLAIPDTDDPAIPAFRRRTLSRRDHFIDILKQRAMKMNDVHVRSLFTNSYKKWNWGRNPKNKALELLTRAWQDGHVSNYNYLLRLNAISGRSIHDPGSYPIMPWVLSNYNSTSVPDLSDADNFRDLTKPMGALCPSRLQKFKEKYQSLCTNHHETSIPPFLYGSHYSNTGGVVLHYLVRVRPFAGLHRQLQGGKFDIPDRLFRSVSQTWEYCSKTSATEVKELTPEWYSNSEFLRNIHNFDLGCVVSDGSAVENVILPPWADEDPEKFIKVMRNALESDYCSEMLPHWIDLIFGYKQRGPEAEKSDNLFYHLSYYDSDDLALVEDDDLRTQIALHIADFGVCPIQLFFEPHPQKHIQQKGELEIMMEHSAAKNDAQQV